MAKDFYNIFAEKIGIFYSKHCINLIITLALKKNATFAENWLK
jgi:hypothetical protein